jgi:hypothetical protein
VAVVEVLSAGLGVVIIAVGLNDSFLTILHPDRDGRLSYGLNRAIWRASVGLARRRPGSLNTILGAAGPTMVIADILLWMALPILGYALLMWPAMGDGIRLPSGVEGRIGDALYFSGTTFTTLGYGDVTPVTRLWEMVAIAEAVTGFLVMGTSVTYIISVFEGVDKRDARALQVYSETGGTWDGGELVRRTLEHGDADILRRRLEEWGYLVRDLHGRLYRFHGLALYVRTHGLDFGPERMLHALCDVALRAQVVAASPHMRRLRPAADQLALGLDHFAKSIVRRNGSQQARDAMDSSVPDEDDRRRVRALWDEMAPRYDLGSPATPPYEDPEVLALACRLRAFLEELERLTLWRRLVPAEGPRGGPSA